MLSKCRDVLQPLPVADKLEDEHSKALRPLVVAAFTFSSTRFSRSIQQLQFGRGNATTFPKRRFQMAVSPGHCPARRIAAKHLERDRNGQKGTGLWRQGS